MYSRSNPNLESSIISNRIVNRMINKLVVVLDETEHRLNNEYAFIYSDTMVNISQVTPVKYTKQKSFRNNTNNNIQITQFYTRNA